VFKNVDWIHVSQDRVQQQGLVDTIINLHVTNQPSDYQILEHNAPHN
jgi:hypothetical protein